MINVRENQANSFPGPIYARADAEMLGMGAGPEEPTQVQPGTETYRYSVTLSYETI